jgi:trehalose 6-phosphate synthase
MWKDQHPMRADSVSMAPPRTRLIVAANRGPAQFYQRANGTFVARPASGGLATAFVSLAAQVDLTWIAVAGNETERRAFDERAYRTVRIGPARVRTRSVPVADRLYKFYYDTISNSTLWFAQHYLLQPDLAPDFGMADRQAWEEGYTAVNRLVADAILDELQTLTPEEQARAVVMIQDYHLYLVPGMLRAAVPTITQTHFLHIPWPALRYWQMLPQAMVNDILTSMLTNTVVGMQTQQDVHNFAACIAESRPQAVICTESDGTTIACDGQRLLVQAYPIGINPAHIRAMAQSRAAKRGFASLAPHFADRQIILRVDRLEPTKNILRGLAAFDLLLDQHPDLCGKVRFVMMLVPSRESVRRYRDYARRVNRLVQRINAKHGTPDDPAVVHVAGNDQARALAAMRCCDVLLVNSVMDGMHLGAKEAAEVNERDGVLVIARTAGVFQQLGDGVALGVAPLDVQETADQLFAALTMPHSQRAEMAREARRRVERDDIFAWLRAQLADARRMAIQPPRRVAVVPAPTPTPAPAHPIFTPTTSELATSIH